VSEREFLEQGNNLVGGEHGLAVNMDWRAGEA
jgi:hypothetical protein